MNGRDPVDSALSSLRSEAWTAKPFTPEMEQKIMSDFRANPSPVRYMKSPVALAAAGVLAIGGVAFAATGGIQELRKWLFKVEINGQQYELVTTEGQPGSVVFEDEAGNRTHLDVATEAVGPDGQKTKVVLRRMNGDGLEESEMESVTKSMTIDVADAASVETARALPLLASWSDNTRSVEVRGATTDENTELAQLHLIVRGFAPQAEEHVLASPTVPATLASGKPTISVTDAGAVHLNFEVSEGPGETRVAKMVFVTNKDAMPDGEWHGTDDANVQVDRENGEVKVRVNSGSKP